MCTCMCMYVCICVYKWVYTCMYSRPETRKTLVSVCCITLQFPPCSASNLSFGFHTKYIQIQSINTHLFLISNPPSQCLTNGSAGLPPAADQQRCSRHLLEEVWFMVQATWDNPQVGSYVLCGAIQLFIMLPDSRFLGCSSSGLAIWNMIRTLHRY